MTNKPPPHTWRRSTHQTHRGSNNEFYQAYKRSCIDGIDTNGNPMKCYGEWINWTKSKAA